MHRKCHTKSIGPDNGTRNRRIREENTRDELPNFPDNNTRATCPSDDGKLMDTILSDRQNSEIGKWIDVVNDEDTISRYAIK